MIVLQFDYDKSKLLTADNWYLGYSYGHHNLKENVSCFYLVIILCHISHIQFVFSQLSVFLTP